MLIICVALNFSYRGYYSRRWEHDFYARKKYLQYVETKNEEVRRNLDEHNRGIAQEEQKRQENEASAIVVVHWVGQLYNQCFYSQIGYLSQIDYKWPGPQII